jgi:uncharacterized protein (TIGR02599 family)
MKLRFSSTPRGAFTLTEVLVSSALIVAIMALMLTTVDQTSRTINSTTARVTQFQSARIAFEAMTRNLSQATLNTYWDLDRDANKNPQRYRRQSDLHFVSGRTVLKGTPARPAKFFGDGGSGSAETENFYPGHATFFQAPLGFTAAETGTGNSVARHYSSLSNLLAVVGYYIKWDKDVTLPGFVKSNPDIVADRYRYRLMEVLQPGETNMVFNNINYTTISNLPGGAASPYRFPTDWIQVSLGHKDLPVPIANAYVPGKVRKVNYSRPLAENIVAMIILPKRAEHDRDKPALWDDLTQDFEYDSRPLEAFEQQAREVKPLQQDVVTLLKARDYRFVRQLHQLPAIVQVTMIAIDEESAVKLQDWVVNSNGGNPPDWMKGLFTKVTTPEAFLKELGDPTNLDKESLIYQISNPDRELPHPRLNYRVFTTDVVMRGAKWSKDN